MEEFQKDEVKEKKSIFGKMFKFGGKKKSKKDKNPKVEQQKASKFNYFLKQIDKEDEMYETVEEVSRLCDEAIAISKEKFVLIDKLYVLSEEVKEMECYESLTDEDVETLKELLARFMSLNKDRSALRYQITGFDKGLEKMEKLEKQAKAIVDNTHEAERQQRFLKHDLGYLHGEKEELIYEREKLISTQELIYKGSIYLVIVSGFITTFLAFIHIFRRVNVFLPAAIMCIILIVAISSMYAFKRHLRRQLAINVKKQHRAIELINKKTVVYAYYTNFLNFVYKKYNVRNSDKLRQNIKDYGNYKHLTTRFDAIRSMLYETEANIEQFLREKGISNSSITTERFAKTVNIDDKRKYYLDLMQERNRLETRLKDLDTKHEKIWDQLVLLNDDDTPANKLIDLIIQEYINEVGKITKFKEDERDKDDTTEDGDNLSDMLPDINPDSINPEEANIDNNNNNDYNEDVT